MFGILITSSKLPKELRCSSADSVYRFYCPTPFPDQLNSGWVCISFEKLCNGIPDCPGAEDEDPTHCMFYRALQREAYHLRKIIIGHYVKFHLLNNE
ncbi:unnamed protein product [Soboliphyme baturini]|uniref:YkgJ family cysteine cluster protein n=1 Tax=Soboliphyme baturini TaxID=241478 RepID=A0A183J7E4_9BILA|nr:unnamed protein product [Soboliphyme baturini]